MFSIVTYAQLIFSAPQLSLFVQLCSFSTKLYVFLRLAAAHAHVIARRTIFLSLLAVIFGSIVCDFAWILSLVKEIFSLSPSFQVSCFIKHIAWLCYIVQYQSLALFLEFLLYKDFRLQWYHYCSLGLSSILCLIYLSYAFLFFPLFKSHSFVIEHYSTIYNFGTYCMQFSSFYVFPLMLPSLYKAIQEVRAKKLPHILNHQLKVFVNLLVLPHLMVEFIMWALLIYFAEPSQHPIISHASVSISTALLTFAIYYCYRRISQLRFLNMNSTITSSARVSFINNFRAILEQLGHITEFAELQHITQIFFKDAFSIELNKTNLYLRKETINQGIMAHPDGSLDKADAIQQLLESSTTNSIEAFLLDTKIIIKDELEFTNFYNRSSDHDLILKFLQDIQADIFLPIYHAQTMIAHIVIERDSRPHRLFSTLERDEMLAFTSYLSSTINILNHGNILAILQKRRELKEELFYKEQEMNQYRESTRSVLRSTHDRKVGILFYSNNQYAYANQDAQDLIGFDINLEPMHQLSQAAKGITKKTQEYKTSQTVVTRDAHNNKIILLATPTLDPQTTIIFIYYPEISDLIRAHAEIVKDPSMLDYLLYLETTNSGQLINQLIPGSIPVLLNFKLQLLATALGKQALLLEMAEDDLLPTVEILHSVSLRKALEVVILSTPEKTNECAVSFFGINHFFSGEKIEPLLQRLDSMGTLYIKNVNFLSIATQNLLADFVTNGFYFQLKSDRKFFSNARIICSTSNSPTKLLQEGYLSPLLFDVLKKISLVMPDLSSLDISELADGFTELALKDQEFKDIEQLSAKDKDTLLDSKPLSLHGLKEKVYELLAQKKSKPIVAANQQVDGTYEIEDPEIIAAVRLGKKALKDPKIMHLLWQTFKNQAKIASMLGVNRSSVNRRCKEYNLLED